MRSKMVFVGVVTIAISVLIGGIVVSASGDEFFGKPKIEEQPTNRSLKINETLREVYGDIGVTRVTPSGDELLGKYEKSDRAFERVIFHGSKENSIIYRHYRTIDGVPVDYDYRIYVFDRDTKELIEKYIHWRDDLPEHLPR